MLFHTPSSLIILCALYHVKSIKRNEYFCITKLITKGNLSLGDLKKDNAEKVIQLSDLETDTKHVPRYHHIHIAVLWLIEEKLFEPAALAFVQSLADKLQTNLGKAFQRNKEKKDYFSMDYFTKDYFSMVFTNC